MLESYIVIGLVIAIVEIAKTFPFFKTERGKLTVPLVVFGAAGLVNVINAFIFTGPDVLVALKDGLTLGAISGGLYSMGKTYLDKSEKK